MSVRWRRVLIFLLGLVPLLHLIFNTVTQQLGADPAKAIVLETGEWALRFLLVVLAVSPLARWFKWRWLMLHRRMLGLFALFYTVLHFISYTLFILGGNFAMLASEIVKRPYILIGMPALVILALLGITSTKSWMRRLGKRWQTLHRWGYLALSLAWLHLAMQVRSSYYEAVVYGGFAFLLLSFRIPLVLRWWLKLREQ